MPPRSRSDVSFVKTSLPFPIFAADFDPYNRGYLVVGGGGGEGRSGVPNQISILDVSHRAVITTAADIDLSRDEDSVQSVGSLATKDGLVIFAGINSSEKDQNAGKNEHLRSFSVKYPPRKKQKTEDLSKEEQGEVQIIGKRSLFKPSNAPKKETYQRILRLSPSQRRESGSKRIGAIATGMAKDSEVIVYNATNTTPDAADILTRIDLPEGLEAGDLDIAETDESEFSVAYCTEYDIYEQTFKYDFGKKRTEKRPNGPRRVHQMPFPDTLESPASRPKFRCLRFLNSQNLVALCNKPNKKGTELRVYHLYPTGPAIMVQEQKLPSHVKQAVSMDVCALDADSEGNQQFAVAVAGQDISIEVFSINYQRHTDTFSSFKSYLTVNDVHQHQMTKICFSPFHAPASATEDQETKEKAQSSTSPAPQYIRLASVSYGNTVVVDTFPLQPLDPTNKTSRYVLSHPSDEAWTRWAYILIISLIVLVVAFMVQSFVGGFGDDSSAGPFGLLPKNFREFLDKPAAAAYGYGKEARYTISSAVDESLPSSMPGSSRLRSLLSAHQQSSGEAPSSHALLVRHSPEDSSLSVDVHPDKDTLRTQDTSAKHWDELQEHEKARWKERLVAAGEWAESEGEKVLVGILFSEYAGMVGQVAGEVIREL